MPAVLKSKYASEDEIPADLSVKDLFEQRGDEFVLVQIEGIKTEADVTRVQRALTQEKEARKKDKATLEDLLAGRKPEEVKADLDRIPELEAATGKIDEDKIHALVEARIKQRISPVERERDQLKQKTAELEMSIVGFVQKDQKRVINDAVRTVAIKAKVQESAIEDVLLNAELVFEPDESGKPVTKDGFGVTAGVSPEVWMTEMQSRRPHWWPASAGGGARPGGGGGYPNNPWSAEHWSVTRQGEAFKALGKEKCEQLARAAGSVFGASKPPSKK